MARWSITLLLLAAMLAGCIQDSDGQDPVPDPDPAQGDDTDPVVGDDDNVTAPTNTTEPTEQAPVQFTASGCDAVALLTIDDYDNIDDFLPAGFIPADVFSLLKLQDAVFIGQGAMGPVVARCQDNSLTGGAVSLVLPGTLVYTPDVADISTSWVDGYEDFIAVSDPVVADLFASFGWDVVAGIDVEVTVHVDEGVEEETDQSQTPGIAVGTVTATLDGEEVLSGYSTASATYHTHDSTGAPIRFWHDTPGGLSYIENHIDQHGRSGGAACSFGGRFAETFGRTECEPDILGLVIADFGLQTTLVRLDGVHA